MNTLQPITYWCSITKPERPASEASEHCADNGVYSQYRRRQRKKRWRSSISQSFFWHGRLPEYTRTVHCWPASSPVPLLSLLLTLPPPPRLCSFLTHGLAWCSVTAPSETYLLTVGTSHAIADPGPSSECRQDPASGPPELPAQPRATNP